MTSTYLVVMQPTPFCNIDCKYCYLQDRSSSTRMSADVVDTVFDSIFRNGLVDQQLDVAWHGGEPLTLPVQYYREKFRIISRYIPAGVKIKHHFQTNGLLINNEWCEFFREFDCKVGVSIDGPKKLNDANRLTRSGRSTFQKSIEAIALLKSFAIDFHIITVLTRESLEHPDAIYDFYANNNITNVCFNFEEIEGANKRSTLETANVEAAVRIFLRNFWNLNVKQGRIHYIREFERMFEAIIQPEGSKYNNIQTSVMGIVNVDVNGNISTFSPELLGNTSDKYGVFYFGNILTKDLSEMESDSCLQDIAKEIEEGVRACRAECAYFQVCGGGMPSNKYYETGRFDSTETLHCRLSVKAVADVAIEILETSAVNELIDQEIY